MREHRAPARRQPAQKQRRAAPSRTGSGPPSLPANEALARTRRRDREGHRREVNRFGETSGVLGEIALSACASVCCEQHVGVAGSKRGVDDADAATGERPTGTSPGDTRARSSGITASPCRRRRRPRRRLRDHGRGPASNRMLGISSQRLTTAVIAPHRGSIDEEAMSRRRGRATNRRWLTDVRDGTRDQISALDTPTGGQMVRSWRGV